MRQKWEESHTDGGGSIIKKCWASAKLLDVGAHLSHQRLEGGGRETKSKVTLATKWVQEKKKKKEKKKESFGSVLARYGGTTANV